MSPRSVVITHEGQPLLQSRLKGSIGPGGRLETIDDRRHPLDVRLLLFAVALFSAVTLTFHPFIRDRWRAKADALRAHSGDLLRDSKHGLRLLCDGQPCFQKTIIHVPEDRPGFPSFWNYANKGSISVSYDERAILLNNSRSLFLGGSLHPVRATPDTWASVLDEAVRNGLNMVTIYVFWSAHQPFQDSPFDWSLPGNIAKCNPEDGDAPAACTWNLATAIREAANRGFFVHARIGPYVCAEFSYGGIPEWVPLNQPNMSMRRPNQEWMDAMEGFMKETIGYFTREQLWAHQGGPIILGQVENELSGDMELDMDRVIMVEGSNGTHRQATMQDYADWSGEVAVKYAPKVLWTMCNGLTAPNAINTCNGNGDCSQNWLEANGQNGRIQVDQPALWTEDEGGFQIWGEEPSHPTSYFWGKTARDVAYDGLKWFARGGSHLNYYMWWGGYNRGRAAAGGVTNKYASDVMLCPSGERREPKFGHLQAFHQILTDLAPYLLEARSALFDNRPVWIMGPNGKWEKGQQQEMFVYSGHPKEGVEYGSQKEVVFVENNAEGSVVAQLHLPAHGKQTIKMEGYSAVVLVNGMLMFDSASVNPRMKAFRRDTIESPAELLDWKSYLEPASVDSTDSRARKSNAPIEQTELMVSSHVSSDYAWYQTTFKTPSFFGAVQDASISIGAQSASAISVYINETHIGTQADPHHEEGNITFTFDLGDLSSTTYTLSILSENFGYGNEIGHWGADTKAKTKGITGSVVITGTCKTKLCTFSLIDGRDWYSIAGLHGEHEGWPSTFTEQKPQEDISETPGVWSRALFDTPSFDASSQSLFLDITTGRGHFWLNGHDLGRYWNITKGQTIEYTQRYYYLPTDYLYSNGHLNELTLFNSLGGDDSSTQLVLSGLVADESASLEDLVDYPNACL